MALQARGKLRSPSPPPFAPAARLVLLGSVLLLGGTALSCTPSRADTPRASNDSSRSYDRRPRAADTEATDGPAADGPTADGPAEAGDGAETDGRIHPSFEMTLATLTALTEGLPAEVSARVAEEPELFLTMAEAVLDAPEEATILVDKEHPLGANYVPEALVPLDGSGLPVDREEMQVTARVLAPLEEMVRAASEDGVRLNIISAYRSYDYQERLFAYWVEELGREEAERVSARAGTSQHQLGTTIDFGYLDRSFAEDPRGTWLAENAGRFGFSLSYPEGYEEVTGYSFEPWHYRWITPEAVSFQNAFFGGIQQYMLEFLHANGEALRAHRELGGES